MPNVYSLEQKTFNSFHFFILGTCQSKSVASSISFGVIYSIPRKKYISNGISHMVCWFMVTDLGKLSPQGLKD